MIIETKIVSFIRTKIRDFFTKRMKQTKRTILDTLITEESNYLLMFLFERDLVFYVHVFIHKKIASLVA